LTQIVPAIETERDMLKRFALPCILLLAQSPAIAAGDDPAPEPFPFRDSCPSGLPAYERALCLEMKLAGGAPCTGSVEARLTCLEGKIAEQARQIVQLNAELDKLTNPRVQPLDQRRLSAQ
jgi:hypothetical protein